MKQGDWRLEGTNTLLMSILEEIREQNKIMTALLGEMFCTCKGETDTMHISWGKKMPLQKYCGECRKKKV